MYNNLIVKKTILSIIMLTILNLTLLKAINAQENINVAKRNFNKIGLALLPIEDYSAKIEAKIINFSKKLENHPIFDLLDREYIEKVKLENQISSSLELNEDEAFFLGKLIQADIIVLISVNENKNGIFTAKAIHTNFGIILFKSSYKESELNNLINDLEIQIPQIKEKEKIEQSIQYHIGLIGIGITRENIQLQEAKIYIEENIINDLGKNKQIFLKELVNLNNVRDETILNRKEFKNPSLDNFIYGNIIVLDTNFILEIKTFDNTLNVISKDIPLNIPVTVDQIKEITSYLSSIILSNKAKCLFTDSNKQTYKIFELGKMYENINNLNLAFDFYQATYYLNPNHTDAIFKNILIMNNKIERAIQNYNETSLEPLQTAYEIETIKLQQYNLLIRKNANYPKLDTKINNFFIKNYSHCPSKLKEKYDQARLQLIAANCPNKEFYITLLFEDTEFLTKAIPTLVKSTNKLELNTTFFWYTKILEKLYPKYNYSYKDLYKRLEIKNEPLFNALLSYYFISRDFRGQYHPKDNLIIEYTELFFKNINEYLNTFSDNILKSKSKDKFSGLHGILLELLIAQNKNTFSIFNENFQKMVQKYTNLQYAFPNVSNAAHLREIKYFHSKASDENSPIDTASKDKLLEKIKNHLKVACESSQKNSEFCESITNGLIYSLTFKPIQNDLGIKFIQDTLAEIQETIITPSLKKSPYNYVSCAFSISKTAKEVCSSEFALKIKNENIKICLEQLENKQNSGQLNDYLSDTIAKLKKL